jgi:ribosomal protein S21
MVNAEVVKSGADTPIAVIRKFSRRVQGTGILKLARNRRYFERPASAVSKKKRALKIIKRREEYVQKVKDGKIIEKEPRRGAHSPERSSPGRFGESTPIAR